MSDQVRLDVRDLGAIFVHGEVDDAGLTVSEFRVYGHLARRAGSDGAYPGIDSMACVCRMNRDTVIEAIKGLSQRRMIRVCKSPGRTNTYLITRRSEWSEIGNANQSEMRNGVVGNEERTSRKSGTKVTPTKLLQLSDLPESIQNDQFLKLWNEWEQHRKQKHSKLTDAARSRQIAKLSQWGSARSIAALNHSMENGYTGIYENGHSKKTTPSRNAGTANAGNLSDYSTVGKRTAA